MCFPPQKTVYLNSTKPHKGSHSSKLFPFSRSYEFLKVPLHFLRCKKIATIFKLRRSYYSFCEIKGNNLQFNILFYIHIIFLLFTCLRARQFVIIIRNVIKKTKHIAQSYYIENQYFEECDYLKGYQMYQCIVLTVQNSKCSKYV